MEIRPTVFGISLQKKIILIIIILIIIEVIDLDSSLERQRVLPSSPPKLAFSFSTPG